MRSCRMGDRLRLSDIPPGRVAMVKSVRGSRGMTSRLATLGFTPGTPVRMVQNFGRGPIIVRVKDAQIALGRREAHWIEVSADDAQKDEGDGHGDE